MCQKEILQCVCVLVIVSDAVSNAVVPQSVFQTIIGDFQKEQKKFVQEQQTKKSGNVWVVFFPVMLRLHQAKLAAGCTAEAQLNLAWRSSLG